MKYKFTKNKFTSLDPISQHKKLSEILRVIYDFALKNNNDIALQSHYDELILWIKETPLLYFDLKSISDRYHYHLKKAQVYHKEHNLLPAISHNDRSQGEPLLPIVIFLENIRSAHNIGSIFRTTEALALGEIYLSANMADINNKQVQDASMQTWQWIKSHTNKNLNDLQRPIIALETVDNGIEINNFIFPEQFTLAVGNEEYGCSNDLLKIADYVINIPLYGKKNSLNVANAFAIASYEIVRQRGTHRKCH